MLTVRFSRAENQTGHVFKIIVSDLIVSFQRQLLRIILTNKSFGDLLRDLPCSILHSRSFFGLSGCQVSAV